MDLCEDLEKGRNCVNSYNWNNHISWLFQDDLTRKFIYIQQIFTEHLLCVSHFSRCWACFSEETLQKFHLHEDYILVEQIGGHGDGNYLSSLGLIIRLWFRLCFLITSLENLNTVKRGSGKYWNLLGPMKLWLLQYPCRANKVFA